MSDYESKRDEAAVRYAPSYGMNEALAQLEEKKCVCGEINARHCPVHQ